MIRKGDIVVIVGSESIPAVLLGQYGEVTSTDNSYKATIQLRAQVGLFGSMSHTAFPSDLKKVGVVRHQPLTVK